MKYNVITYIGKTPGFTARLGSYSYEFEWQKGLGIGSRSNEVKIDHAVKFARWRDKRGKKIFVLE
jgi:hypothetical protein